jgi:hypothetical protein
MPDNNKKKIPGLRKTNKYTDIEAIVFYFSFILLLRNMNIKKINIIMIKKQIGIIIPHIILKKTKEIFVSMS